MGQPQLSPRERHPWGGHTEWDRGPHGAGLLPSPRAEVCSPRPSCSPPGSPSQLPPRCPAGWAPGNPVLSIRKASAVRTRCFSLIEGKNIKKISEANNLGFLYIIKGYGCHQTNSQRCFLLCDGVHLRPAGSIFNCLKGYCIPFLSLLLMPLCSVIPWGLFPGI